MELFELWTTAIINKGINLFLYTTNMKIIIRISYFE